MKFNIVLAAVAVLMSHSVYAQNNEPPASVVAAAKIRNELIAAYNKAPPAAGKMAEFLSFRVLQLNNSNLSKEVANRDALIDEFVEDLRLKALAANKIVNEEENKKSAKNTIVGGNVTALTNYNDMYIRLKGGAKHDEIHEFIHILTVRGGESILNDFKSNFNEGVVNYFAEIVSKNLQFEIPVRYPDATPIAKKYVKLLGVQGEQKLFDLAFKGKIDEFFLAVGEVVIKDKDKFPSGKPKGFTEKNITAQEMADAFKAKTKNWELKYLTERLPAI